MTISGVLTGGQTPAQFLLASDFIFNGQIAVTVQTPDGWDFGTLYDDMAASNPNQAANNTTHIFAVDATKGITFEMIGSGFTFTGGTPTGGTITEIDILDTTDPTLTTQDHVLVNTNGWNIPVSGVSGLFTAITDYATPATHAQGVTELNAIFAAHSYTAVGALGSSGPSSGNDGQPLTGADTFIASNQADAFNGFAGPFGPSDPGNDTVTYQNASVGLTADLSNSANNLGIAAAGDRYISIENLRGSGFNDVLRGDGNNNVLEGGLGTNTIDGGSGGTDTASYQHATAGVTVNLTVSGPQVTGGAGTDTLTSIENLRGSSFNDTLTGGDNSVLEGGAGADHLIGATGSVTASYEHATSGVTVISRFPRPKTPAVRASIRSPTFATCSALASRTTSRAMATTIFWMAVSEVADPSATC